MMELVSKREQRKCVRRKESTNMNAPLKRISMMLIVELPRLYGLIRNVRGEIRLSFRCHRTATTTL